MPDTRINLCSADRVLTRGTDMKRPEIYTRDTGSGQTGPIRTQQAAILLLIIPVLLLSGCLSLGLQPEPFVVEGDIPQTNGRLTTAVVKPGESARCRAPCRIYYHTPEIDRPVTIIANNFKIGTFPPGRLVMLGHFTKSTVRITIEDSNVPTAFVNTPD